MALSAHLSISGARQGPILGSVTQKGFEGTILVHGFFHKIVAPRDPTSGTPTGKRAHKPFTIVKSVDAASPLLFTALVTNENLPMWQLRMYRPSPGGRQEHYFTVTLTDATVSGVSLYMSDRRTRARSDMEAMEQVHFTYRRIEVECLDGGALGSDDWAAPRSV